MGISNAVSQGKQSSNSIIFAESQTNISVKYYYPASFLKPKMLPVAGSNSWNYGISNTNTNTVIPTLQWAETEIT
ncbi:MAG: hypothetical protein LBJ17_00990 [Dysgonamonadaceae bacterium]|nr:hypothetical protein [Dysgonamonadaceae bacterium]